MTEEAYDAQIIVRLPSKLKEWAQGQAKANHRSMNGQMVAWLEDLQHGREKSPEDGVHTDEARRPAE